MESNYQVTTQMRNKFAMHMFHVKLPMDFVDSINAYIDNTLIPLDDNYGKVKGNAELEHSYSKGLVGQIRQNEKSAQLDCKVLDNTEDAKLLKSTLDATSQEYLRQIGHGDSVPDVFEAWTVHSYEGNYNPLHDHDVSYDQKCMAFSIILYCMVPPQIAKLGDNTKLHSNGGATDGCTYFTWGTNTGADHLVLKPKTDRYVVPEEGKFLIFPSWLNNSVAPFYGPGERRTLSANFRVPFGASAKDESSGDLHFKNMFDRDSKKEPEVTADTPISDIL